MPRRAFLLSFCLLLAGCGYPGDPLPPALNIPVRVDDLRGRQHGDKIVFEFTPHLETTDKLILKSLRGIDFRGGLRPDGDFNHDAWAANARTYPIAETTDAQVAVEVPPSDWMGREVLFAVRTIGPTGRASDWSNIVTLQIAEPLVQPSGLATANTDKGIALSWSAGSQREGSAWRVFRITGAEPPMLLGRATEPRWVDETSVFGTPYEYFIQRVAYGGDSEAESIESARIAITPKDEFPPKPPAGLRAFTGVNTVELAWERNTEPDFAFYQVWRSTGGALEKLGDKRALPSFTDSAVERGKQYRYAVTSIDSAGNESTPSDPVEIAAP